MRDFSSLFNDIKKDRFRKEKEINKFPAKTAQVELTEKNIKCIESILLFESLEMKSSSFLAIDKKYSEAFLAFCEERGLFLVYDSALERWARSIKSERLFTKILECDKPKDFISIASEYNQIINEIKQKAERVDFLEVRAGKLKSIKEVFNFMENGSTLLKDIEAEFSSEKIHLQFEADSKFDRSYCDEYNVTCGQCESVLFFIEAIYRLNRELSEDSKFLEISDRNGKFVRMRNAPTNFDLYLICWDGYKFLRLGYPPLHYLENCPLLNEPKFILDYNLLNWLYDVNADLIFERIKKWLIIAFEDGEDDLRLTIKANVDQEYSSIYYEGLEEWSVPVCPKRFSLAASLRNLPHTLEPVGGDERVYQQIIDGESYSYDMMIIF